MPDHGGHAPLRACRSVRRVSPFPIRTSRNEFLLPHCARGRQIGVRTGYLFPPFPVPASKNVFFRAVGDTYRRPNLFGQDNRILSIEVEKSSGKEFLVPWSLPFLSGRRTWTMSRAFCRLSAPSKSSMRASCSRYTFMVDGETSDTSKIADMRKRLATFSPPTPATAPPPPRPRVVPSSRASMPHAAIQHILSCLSKNHTSSKNLTLVPAYPPLATRSPPHMWVVGHHRHPPPPPPPPPPPSNPPPPVISPVA